MSRDPVRKLVIVLVPILIGAFVYYIFSPEVLFVKRIDAIFSIHFHLKITKQSQMLTLVRNYLPDAAWSFSLVLAALYWICPRRRQAWTVLLPIGIFDMAAEILQLSEVVRGTFDVWDLVTQFLAGFVAYILWRRTTNEEENIKNAGAGDSFCPAGNGKRHR